MDSNDNVQFALMTAARNEEAYIGNTIQSVIAQGVRPRVWVIVSDGSTDRTDAIVKEHAERHPFIRLERTSPNQNRSFASKVFALRAGLEVLSDAAYDYIGNLDADITFERDYFERLFQKLEENPKLGIAGGVLFDSCGDKWIRQFTSPAWSVAGPVQMFRRRCFEDIEGYIPMPRGGEDGVAEVMARMHGWEVRTFPDLTVLHHRRMGTEKENIVFAKFREGVLDRGKGAHPLFELSKCVGRIRERPYVLAGLSRLAGYCFAFLRRDKTALPPDVHSYMKREQLRRLFGVLRRPKELVGNYSRQATFNRGET